MVHPVPVGGNPESRSPKMETTSYPVSYGERGAQWL
jgi:hypothetical protein